MGGGEIGWRTGQRERENIRGGRSKVNHEEEVLVGLPFLRGARPAATALQPAHRRSEPSSPAAQPPPHGWDSH